jgi:hypothetical protein
MPDVNLITHPNPVSYKPIGESTKYRVGDDGRVQSLRNGQWCDLKPYLRGRGYLVVEYRSGATWARRCVHHVVLEAFVGPCPPGGVARHIDGDKTNNAASNLRWGTLSGNVRDSIRHGTHGVTKLTEDHVRTILDSDDPASVLAERFGVGLHTIYSVRGRKSWAWV